MLLGESAWHHQAIFIPVNGNENQTDGGWKISAKWEKE